MRTAGIIAEYNPFHNGHAYHIRKTREKTNADYVVAAMSGDFVQRGAPAITDKFTRAKAALQAGADLVLEIPVLGSVSSAEGFARAGIRLLASLGIVTDLSFGSEIREPEEEALLLYFSEVLSENQPKLSRLIREQIKTGCSFPEAREEALVRFMEADPAAPVPDASETARRVLKQPNNILALEYMKELNLQEHEINPVLIHRVGNEYHDKEFHADYSSAEAIRNAVWNHPDESLPDTLLSCMNETDAQEFYRQYLERVLLCSNDFSQQLHYALIEQTDVLDYRYAQEPELARRIQNNLENYLNWNQFVSLLKVRSKTYTAVSRYLTQILTGITWRSQLVFQDENFVPYIRVLGFRRDAAPLLDAIRKHSEAALVTSVRDAESRLSDRQLDILHLDLRAADLCNAVRTAKTQKTYINDYRHPLVYL